MKHDPNNIDCPCAECQAIIAEDWEANWGDDD